MATEILLPQTVVLEQAPPVESLGQRSIRLFRRDMQQAVVTAHNSYFVDPLEFVDVTLSTMTARRPREKQVIESFAPQIYFHLRETEALLADQPRHLSFPSMSHADLLTVIAANELNLATELIIRLHPLIGTAPVDLMEDFGVQVFVHPKVHRGLMAGKTKPSVFRQNNVPVITSSEREKVLARSVSALLPLVDRVPEEGRVSGVVFDPSKDLGCGSFSSVSNTIIVGSYNGLDMVTKFDVLMAFSTAVHEVDHSYHYTEGFSRFPSLVNELEASRDTYKVLDMLPGSWQRFVSQPSSGADYKKASAIAASEHQYIRDMVCHRDPKKSFYADYNIGVMGQDSDERAAGINVDLFPK